MPAEAMETRKGWKPSRYKVLSICSIMCIVSLNLIDPGDDVQRFVGCYGITRLSWNPPDYSTQLIPEKFQLWNIPLPDSGGLFAMHSLYTGEESKTLENFWTWKPEGKNRLKVTWSTGFGGFRGSLRRQSDGDLVGKIKEWCDYRCDWKTRTGLLRIHPITCPTP